jgi:hypothetical protein
MTVAKSQSYGIDNRFREAKGVSDDTEGLNFLRTYLDARQNASRFPTTLERLGDDRFVFPAQGGTVPIGALPSEPRGPSGIVNTDSSAGFRNSFRATPS